MLCERPVRSPHAIVKPVHEAIELEQAAAREAAEQHAERAAPNHGVELIAVRHEQTAPGARGVNRLERDFDVAERRPCERAQLVVVIAGDVDDPRSVAAHLEQRAQHVHVARGPVEALAQALEIDDVADKIEQLAARAPQEVEDEIHAAVTRP